MPDGLDIAWAAGLFEGEGSIYLDRSDQRRRGGRVRLGMSLSTTDEDVARKFSGVAGGSVFGPYTAKRSTKPYWTWHLRDQEAIHVLVNALWPYLGKRRRQQIDEALGAKDAADAEHRPKPLGQRGLPRLIAGQLGLKW